MTTTQMQATETQASSMTPTPEQQRRRDALHTLSLPTGLAPRLRNEQGWSPAFTEDVIAEYRRFLILATTTDRRVTPSRTVDHAWHAHLEYTHAYWDTLCQGLLGEALHHTPGEPGDEAHYRQQYLDTLDLYREVFGEAAPLHCWPDPRHSLADGVGALNHPNIGRQAGQTSPFALMTTLIIGLGSLAFGLNGGGALLSLLGGLLSCGALLLALTASLRTGLTDGQPPTTRRTSASSDFGTDMTMIALGGGDGSDSGSCGHDGGGDGGASCGSSCGSSCGGGCS
ncbi:glycine-rich domain-containing protein [Deinococcus ruber]|uniref:TIGR04222 domain-containing membrane protein n=1 Tax=Deinococcus ruber TaxID=1848197 RepID=A0A918FFY2_9DEIO|nr:hypothetical protein [Deinococcus ruber]GGR35520.1 hypothetical protein GCM10008957_51830 [Deinococcus ruber]